MKQECPYMNECKLQKEAHRCYDSMKYVKCIIYQRYQQMGYDIKNDNLGIGATVEPKPNIHNLLALIKDLGPDWYENYLKGVKK